MIEKGIPVDQDTILASLKATSQIGDIKSAFNVL